MPKEETACRNGVNVLAYRLDSRRQPTRRDDPAWVWARSYQLLITKNQHMSQCQAMLPSDWTGQMIWDNVSDGQLTKCGTGMQESL